MQAILHLLSFGNMKIYTDFGYMKIKFPIFHTSLWYMLWTMFVSAKSVNTDSKWRFHVPQRSLVYSLMRRRILHDSKRLVMLITGLNVCVDVRTLFPKLDLTNFFNVTAYILTDRLHRECLSSSKTLLYIKGSSFSEFTIRYDAMQIIKHLQRYVFLFPNCIVKYERNLGRWSLEMHCLK